MALDIQTLLVLMMTNVFVIALALPAIMGWQVSTAARFVLGSAVAQGLGWLAFLVAPRINDRWLSTLSMALLSGSFVSMWHALRHWLGPRPGRRLLWLAAGLTPVGYGLGFESYAFRVGWSNFGLALQMCLVCLAVAWPAPHASRRWRTLVFVCLAAMVVVTVWRGVLGAFFTELYPYYRAPHPVNIAAAVLNHLALMLWTMAFLVAWREEAERELRRQAETDSLTGLLNRRVFAERAADLLANARRYGEKLAVVMIDIDHFKQINDRHGHAVGDHALSLLAQVLRASARRGDLVCRYGGEEFCAVLWHADAHAAACFDDRVRSALKLRLREVDPAVAFDFSAGVAVRTDADTSIEDLLRRADAALYAAKAEGRARMVNAQPLVQPV
ncbi:GGDEF domain-containing protein [Methylibium rhizosphaerae]|uniref:GGDEF domain-containing protein n=1 Tax=Methylibium rhizosphaerae TaxID=2570323 RepID=UPI001126E89D|nr:GGDEF domain-containing protein [Methylibium rhizosphaerae]